MSASPGELFRQLCLEWFDESELPGGVYVGPVDFEEIEKGTISIIELGLSEQEPYVPLIRQQITVYILHPDLDKADQITRVIRDNCLQWERRLVYQPSTGEYYLVHDVSIAGGPTMAFIDRHHWEIYIIINMLIGTQEA